MNKPFNVPMSPDQLPQQRIVEVVTLPPAPAGFEPVTDWRALEELPIDHDTPVRETFLSALEWAWSPMHNRLQGFSLEHHNSGYWLLWSYFVDFVENDEHPWVLSAACRQEGLDERTAAIHLMIAALTEGRNFEELDHYHWIADDGFVTPAEMREIGRWVWRSEDDSDEGESS